MWYVHKPQPIQVYKWTGEYSEETWPDFLPRPVVAAEYQSLYSKDLNTCYLLKESKSGSIVADKGNSLYVIMHCIGNPVKIHIKENLVLQVDGSIVTMRDSYIESNYDLVES